jgi:hypothetical protein
MIDVAFDFRSDTPAGKDPDTYSRMLRNYHRRLWSKPLPGGVPFELTENRRGVYLYHGSGVGEHFLSSDGAIPTFWKEAGLRSVFAEIRMELEVFQREAYTIGGMIVFPSNKINGKMTINGARGFCRQIRDRFDLTVECIRRHYLLEPSPLQDVLARYATFFALFGDFRGYAQHFLLQDLVAGDFAAIRFFAPFDNFGSPPIPDSRDSYLSYRDAAMKFIAARGRRMQAYFDRPASSSPAG